MELYLMRQGNGSFMLTYFRPTVCHLYGNAKLPKDAFVQAGEPVGVRNLCRRGVVALFGREAARMKRLDIRKVRLSAPSIWMEQD